jgi:hypothetical protein
MAIRLASDPSRAGAFPGGQLKRPSIELLARLAPSRSLVDTLMAERGLEFHDARAGMAREMTYQARALEAGYRRDETIMRLRGLVDTLIAYAARICRAYQDAADRLLCCEVEVTQAERVTAHGGSVWRARATRCMATRSRDGLPLMLRKAPRRR